MPRKHWTALFLALTVAFAPGLARADKASQAQWENLSRLKPGQKIRVIQKDSTSWKGRFTSVSADAFEFRAAGADKMIARADVQRVNRKGGKHWRNALIGAAIGAGTGIGLGLAGGSANCSSYSFGPCIGRGTATSVFGVAFAIVGAGVGAIVPGSTVVYRAPQQ